MVSWRINSRLLRAKSAYADYPVESTQVDFANNSCGFNRQAEGEKPPAHQVSASLSRPSGHIEGFWRRVWRINSRLLRAKSAYADYPEESTQVDFANISCGFNRHAEERWVFG
jgi:hypothetical protein